MTFSTAPISAFQALRLAERHQREGRHGLAADLCRNVLRGEPQNGAAMQVLGLSLQRLGCAAEAIDVLRRSVQLAPRAAAWRNNLSVVLAHSAAAA